MAYWAYLKTSNNKHIVVILKQASPYFMTNQVAMNPLDIPLSELPHAAFEHVKKPDNEIRKWITALFSLYVAN